MADKITVSSINIASNSNYTLPGGAIVTCNNVSTIFPDIILENEGSVSSVTGKAISFYAVNNELTTERNARYANFITVNNSILEFRGKDVDRDDNNTLTIVRGKNNTIRYTPENFADYNFKLQHKLGYLNLDSKSVFSLKLTDSVVYNYNNKITKLGYNFHNNTYHIFENYTQDDLIPLQIYSYKTTTTNGESRDSSVDSMIKDVVYMGGCTLVIDEPRFGFVFEITDDNTSEFRNSTNNVAIISDLVIQSIANDDLDSGLPLLCHPATLSIQG